MRSFTFLLGCLGCWMLGLCFAMTGGKSVQENHFNKLVGDNLIFWGKSSSGINQIQSKNTADLLGNKNAVALYFSASWCGPCRQFTPNLVSYYREVNKRGQKFEIILVSQDQTEESFYSYFEKMPWLAIPYESVPEYIDKLSIEFRLKGIPHLVLLDGYDASVITLDGRNKVLNDKYGLEFPYRPRTIVNALPRSIRRSVQRIQSQFKNKLSHLSLGFLTVVRSTFTRLKVKLWNVALGAVHSVFPERIVALFR